MPAVDAGTDRPEKLLVCTDRAHAVSAVDPPVVHFIRIPRGADRHPGSDLVFWNLDGVIPSNSLAIPTAEVEIVVDLKCTLCGKPKWVNRHRAIAENTVHGSCVDRYVEAVRYLCFAEVIGRMAR